MRELNMKEKYIIVDEHNKFLATNKQEIGERANFCGRDMFEVNFSGMVFRDADFSKANLSGSNFDNCDVRGVDFSGADLRRASFIGADFDFSCWLLWCGSEDVKVDDRLVLQLFHHLTSLNVEGCSEEVKKEMERLREHPFYGKFLELRETERTSLLQKLHDTSENERFSPNYKKN